MHCRGGSRSSGCRSESAPRYSRGCGRVRGCPRQAATVRASPAVCVCSYVAAAARCAGAPARCSSSVSAAELEAAFRRGPGRLGAYAHARACGWDVNHGRGNGGSGTDAMELGSSTISSNSNSNSSRGGVSSQHSQLTPSDTHHIHMALQGTTEGTTGGVGARAATAGPFSTPWRHPLRSLHAPT